MRICEYEARVKNLITSLISLKEYAIDIERSIQNKPSLSYVHDGNIVIGSNSNVNQLELKEDNINNLKMINSLQEVRNEFNYQYR